MINIDALSENVAKELKTLSTLLSGSPILIGEKNGFGLLEDDVVFWKWQAEEFSDKLEENKIPHAWG